MCCDDIGNCLPKLFERLELPRAKCDRDEPEMGLAYLQERNSTSTACSHGGPTNLPVAAGSAV